MQKSADLPRNCDTCASSLSRNKVHKHFIVHYYDVNRLLLWAITFRDLERYSYTCLTFPTNFKYIRNIYRRPCYSNSHRDHHIKVDFVSPGCFQHLGKEIAFPFDRSKNVCFLFLWVLKLNRNFFFYYY